MSLEIEPGDIITIDGNERTVSAVSDLSPHGYTVEFDDGKKYEEWAVFETSEETSEEAGEDAAERWRDMAENDPSEFRAMVGDECLIAWALGQMAGPGNEPVGSLDDWFDLTADHPEEEWGTYDGNEWDGTLRHFLPYDEGDDQQGEQPFEETEVVLYRNN